MDQQDLQFIQASIGYKFQNEDLLQQAFIRRSYAKENGGGDNEVLEFIGDKVLDLCVVKFLTDTYGYFSSDCDDFDSSQDWNEFFSHYTEGKLTEYKQRLVEKKMLAHRIDMLGFSDFLIMGNGDVRRNIQQENSVKEDLFEAILGAVALDSQWNLQKLESTVDVMLDPAGELQSKNNENYVQFIYNWVERKHGSIPIFRHEQFSYLSSWRIPFDGVSQTFPLNQPDYLSLKQCCYLRIDNHLPIFRGFGKSKSDARRGACKTAYDYLAKNNLLYTIREEIDHPCREQAINQLETLARRGYFSLPAYDFELKHDDDGNPVWVCRCCIAEYDDCYWAESSSKKDAKKDAAFSMLSYVLD